MASPCVAAPASVSISTRHGALHSAAPHRPSGPCLARPLRTCGGSPGQRASSSQRAAVVCSVSGGPKKATAKKAVVLRVEDPLAGRTYRPAMPGDDPGFWEGGRWDILGFVLQYLWAFGIVLAAAASLYAVSSYNGGETPAEGAPATEAQSEAAAPGAALPGVESYPDDDAPPL